MSFLWQLLPGAREARNQVVIGYVWLVGLGLQFGVPAPDPASTLGEVVATLGPVGVGLGLGFVAFLLGSVSDELFGAGFRTRGAQALSLGNQGVPPVLTIRRMEEWGVRAELERLESSIDRLNAEVLLRAGLVMPVALAIFGSWPHDRLTSMRVGAVLMAAVVLIVQTLIRFRRLHRDLARSAEIRASVARELDRDPEALRMREEDAEAQRADEFARIREQETELQQRVRDHDEARQVQAGAMRRLEELSTLRSQPKPLGEVDARRLDELEAWKWDLDELEGRINAEWNRNLAGLRKLASRAEHGKKES